jgi:alpha-1,2-mannosyltransferase
LDAIVVDMVPASARRPAGDLVRRLPGRRACLLLYAGSVLAFLASPLGHHWPFVDLTVYRYGGQAILHGAHLYALRFPGALAFTYPPLAALLFAPLTVPAMALLKPLLTAASLALLVVMLRSALRLSPVSTWLNGDQATRLALLAAAAALWLEPVWTTLRYGQIDLLIGALVLYDLSRADSSRWKGVGIGLAIAVKLTPAIFMAYLLLTRRYRAAVTSAAVFVATVALGFIAIPGDSASYWSGAFIDPSRVGRIENAANQALRGAWARLLHSMNVEALWLLTAGLVGVAGIALAVRAGRRGNDALGVSLCALTGLLISPVSWSHHWVLAIPALLLFALAAYRRGSVAGLIAAGAVAIVGYSHVIWWVPIDHPRHSELHLGALGLVYADTYVLLGLLALVLVGLAPLLAADRGRGRTHRVGVVQRVRSRRASSSASGVLTSTLASGPLLRTANDSPGTPRRTTKA